MGSAGSPQSCPEKDPTWALDCGQAGFKVMSLLNEREFQGLRASVSTLVGQIFEQVTCSRFTSDLTEYHRLVTNEDDHQAVVRKTRDLYETGLGINTRSLIGRISSTLGLTLDNRDPISGQEFHTIVRINRPLSDDWNPPHRDSDGPLSRGECSPFLNVWIPIAGVTPQSSLPLVPGSHRLTESQIVGADSHFTVNKKPYRVRPLASWGDSSELMRPEVAYGSCLIFSPFLIHGLAVNKQPDTTRVSLELRLHLDHSEFRPGT